MPSSIGQLKHPLESLLVFEHVDVLVWNFTPRESLPGSSCVGSKVFAKNNDFFCHGRGYASIKNKRASMKLQGKFIA